MKNFKLITISLLMALATFFMFACANKEVATAPTEKAAETTQKVEKVKFIVGFDAEYPPYGYLAEDGKSYEGFDLDLAKEVCNRTNMEFVPQPIDWDSKDMELNAGNIDCIWSGFTINGRENDYEWTVPYVDNSIVLVVNSDSGIKKKKDLSGKTLITQAASSALDALTNEENVENAAFVKTLKALDQCPDYNTAFMNLESGAADCVAVDIGVAKYNLNNSNGKFYQLEETVSSEQYGIGFKKGNSALKNKVESALFDMWKDGTFSKIADKYKDYSLPDMICIGNFAK